MKRSPPARGQIESDVVADVSVPRSGESRDSKRGGRSKGLREDGEGRSDEASDIISA